MAKRALRQELKVVLKELDRGYKKRASRAILKAVIEHPRVQEANAVAVFVGADKWTGLEEVNEVDTLPMVEYFLTQPQQLYVPVMMPDEKGQMDFYQINSASCLRPNDWGVLEPSLRADRQDIPKLDLMVIPGLAFHREQSGSIQRMGRGGGYYDIFFEKYKQVWGELPYTIGVGFNCQLVEKELVVEEHDVPLNEIIVD